MSKGKGRIYVNINGKEMSKPLEKGENKTVFNLSSGEANLDIWFQENGKPREIYTENNTIGDVDVKLIN